MSYGEFTLDSAIKACDLKVAIVTDLFSEVPEAPVTPRLLELLEENVPLATMIHTEKARSEFIVAPILGEVRRRKKHQVSLFSGIAFDVDREKGLNGICDFLLSRSPMQLYLQSPIMAVVEAKNDDFSGGIGQCVAEMVAAQIYNKRTGQPASPIFGAVTTGSLWKFMKISGLDVSIDEFEHHLGQLPTILGILLHCVESTEVEKGLG